MQDAQIAQLIDEIRELGAQAAGKRKSLGYFETAELAYEAYKAAAIRLHTCNPLSAE